MRSQRPNRPLKRRVTILGTALLACGAVLPASASAASVSANWAGYVALPKPTAKKTFKSVSGTWTVPAVSCSAGHEAFSVVWVGLGGYDETSNGLEQIGTEADCSPSGRALYSSWYELIPAGAVTVPLAVKPGDEVTASVTVKGRVATLRLRDLTSGARYSVTRRVKHLDRTSADWIVEAPSSCSGANSCQTLPLSDFNAVAFSAATATLGGVTAPIDSPYWRDVELELRQGGGARALGGRPGAGFVREAKLITAAPSALTSTDGAFSVAFREPSLQSAQPEEAPSYPGLHHEAVLRSG